MYPYDIGRSGLHYVEKLDSMPRNYVEGEDLDKRLFACYPATEKGLVRLECEVDNVLCNVVEELYEGHRWQDNVTLLLSGLKDEIVGDVTFRTKICHRALEYGVCRHKRGDLGNSQKRYLPDVGSKQLLEEVWLAYNTTTDAYLRLFVNELKQNETLYVALDRQSYHFGKSVHRRMLRVCPDAKDEAEIVARVASEQLAINCACLQSAIVGNM